MKTFTAKSDWREALRGAGYECEWVLEHHFRTQDKRYGKWFILWIITAFASLIIPTLIIKGFSLEDWEYGWIIMLPFPVSACIGILGGFYLAFIRRRFARCPRCGKWMSRAEVQMLYNRTIFYDVFLCEHCKIYAPTFPGKPSIKNKMFRN
ncbi:MAG: hypothetical protein K6B46_00100 [Opitutales bacterium]|nr:hypothetical protein [Opitutales bacterium]